MSASTTQEETVTRWVPARCRVTRLGQTGRVGEGVTAPLLPQNRACASNALGSSHGSFALLRRSRLSMAVPCTGHRNSSFRPVSQPWLCPCDAGLPSDGSRRPRFPAVCGTMPALRPPARPPFGLFLRQPVPRFACCFAPSPPQAGAGPDLWFPPGVRVPALARGPCRVSQVP